MFLPWSVRASTTERLYGDTLYVLTRDTPPEPLPPGTMRVLADTEEEQEPWPGVFLAQRTLEELYEEFGPSDARGRLSTPVAVETLTALMHVVRRVRSRALLKFRAKAREYTAQQVAVTPEARGLPLAPPIVEQQQQQQQQGRTATDMLSHWLSKMDAQLVNSTTQGRVPAFQFTREDFARQLPASLRLVAAALLEYIVPHIEALARRLEGAARRGARTRQAGAGDDTVVVVVWQTPIDMRRALDTLTFTPRTEDELREHVNILIRRAWTLAAHGALQFQAAIRGIRQSFATLLGTDERTVLDPAWLLLISILTWSDAAAAAALNNVREFLDELLRSDPTAYSTVGRTLVYMERAGLPANVQEQRTRRVDPCPFEDLPLPSADQLAALVLQLRDAAPFSQVAWRRVAREFYETYLSRHCGIFSQRVLDVSYITGPATATAATTDSDGDEDVVLSSAELDFLEAARALRGNASRNVGRRRAVDGEGDNDDDNNSDETNVDETRYTLTVGLGAYTIAERAAEMLRRPPTGETVADVPRFDGTTVHGDDPGYFRLYLSRYDVATSTRAGRLRSEEIAALDDETRFAHAARRRWWLRMLAVLFRENITDLPGQAAARNFAYEEFAVFLQSPTVFASNDVNNAIITGPPGSGKTSFSRTMHAVYHLLGLYVLGTFDPDSAPLITPSNLIAPFEGQTMAKTTETLLRHLGQQLSIDEAYALVQATNRGSGSEFGQQAVDQMTAIALDIGSLMSLFLIGYTGRIQRQLQRANEGLSRRFPRRVDFAAFSGQVLYQVLVLYLTRSYGASAAERLDRSTLVAFFEFLTGEHFQRLDQPETVVIEETTRDSFTYTTEEVPPDVVTLWRYPYASRRSDETEDDFLERVTLERNAGLYGNIVENENASLAIDLVNTLRRRQVAASAITTSLVIDLVLATITRRGYVRLHRQQAADTESTSVASDTEPSQPQRRSTQARRRRVQQ